MALNEGTVTDENGNDSLDWLEILNPTSSTIDLTGWHLSDKTDNPTKWTFPPRPAGELPADDQLILAPGQSLIVFLSGEDRRTANGDIHTNFSISAEGENILLSNPQNNLIDSHPNFPAQRLNTSAGWGLNPETALIEKLRFFLEPTPHTLNIPSICDVLSNSPNIFPSGQLYPSGALPVSISITLPANAHPGTQLHYTLDGSNPSEASPRYLPPSGNDPGTQLTASATTIVRAVALLPGCVPSPISSRSYLFTDSILGTSPQGTLPSDAQIRPASYPADAIGLNGNQRVAVGLLDYDIDPEVVQDHRSTLEQELLTLPSISITCPVADLFGLDSGIYSNSSLTDHQPDPQSNDWRRLVSVEYLDPLNPLNTIQDNAELAITGDTSRSFSATDKHSVRMRFRSRFSKEGNSSYSFNAPLFPTSIQRSFKQLNLRHPNQDGYTLKWSPNIPILATYVKSSWVQELHARMGLASGSSRHLKANHRWVHLFLNGLHWGIYDLSERVDEDFARTYGVAQSDYDVLKESGDIALPADHEGIVDGDYRAWTLLRSHCQNAAANPLALPAANSQTEWLAVTRFLDLENYIDYLLAQMYVNVRDWPTKNFRTIRRRGNDEALILDPPQTTNPGGKFQFLVWDAESSMLPLNGLPDRTLSTTGVAEFHGILANHPAYQEIFRQRVALHFTDPGGILTPDPNTGHLLGYDAFQEEMDLFGGTRDASGTLITHGGLFTESARWGDNQESATLGTLTYSDPSYRPTSSIGDWKRNTTKFRDTFDPSRRSNFLNLLRSLNLADPE